MTPDTYRAIQQRDREKDGTFFFGRMTSLTVCRPSCTLPCPRPEKTVIFQTLEEAIGRGYHPCSRCRPDLETWCGAGDALAKSSIRYLTEHLALPFSLREMAAALYVNPSHLARTFQRETGETILQCLHHLRCEKAREFLQNPEYSLGQIASMCGFSTPSHFSRIFRDVEGVTPSRWRKDYFASLLKDSNDL
ncbi:MAG: methylphosphotriester-DNA--protein-cysteine methyltransferase family protein [Clostridia bacterium]|nr:methylphosphotriester-DNA--protein-cysteine methyltransferase family protein [Clostridia bacterium]